MYSRTASAASRWARRTRATPTGSSRPTSHDARLPQSHVADVRRRARARRHLRADGGRNRPRLRRPPTRQFRLRAAHDGRRLRARLRRTVGAPELAFDPLLLRCGAGAVGADGPSRVPAAAHALAGGDARGDVRRSLRPPERRAHRLRPARQDSRPVRGAPGALGHPRRLRSQDRDHRHRDRRRLPRPAPAPAHADAGRAPHARGRNGLRDGADARRPGEPGDRRRGPDLWAARGGRGRDAQRPTDSDHEHVRPVGDDLRTHGRRARRPQSADPRHTRRFLDRLRVRAPRRDPADEPEPVPAKLHLRGRHRRPAREAEWALHPRGCSGGARVTVARRIPELLAPAILVLATALLSFAVSSYLQAYFLDTLVKVAIVVALYVFIGNSGVLSFGTISFV